MKNNKFTIGVVITTAVLLLGGIVLANQMKSNSPELTINERVEATVIGDAAHDWGEIVMDEGNQETTFTIKNNGDASLQLYGINTSCMCTTAQLMMGDQQSPTFGMHNKSKYIFEVPPQEEAQLKVVFDPAYHGPNGVGPINRQVQISTNDPANPMLQFMVTGMVRR